ncbi:putative receptor-like protein kinase At3g47110 [Hevea brasiliensis]|uniref:putative receptor-like protein kinase At3g47110 n=1 Tax=Hevea brasiliensis TaxID=3981 RepID=UPI0025D6DB84|nr:putative receptor-like protein kinase At3g47110 [Hevea brasiliensis]
MELRITRLTTLWPSIHHFQVILLFYTSLLCLQPPTDCLRNLGNETDRLALLEFKSKIGNDPHDVFSSWNDSVNFCKWQGITCGRKHHRVTSLNLYGLSLSGTISPFIGNLTFLRFLNLRNNSFHGEIPQEVGRLSRLRHLNLTDNRLGGEIPLNITYCSELRILILARNRFVGKILDELGSLKKLVSLDLYGNNLTGEIPHSFGNLSSFKHLSVAVNNLAGNIPNKLGQLTGLTFFSVGVNNLIGTIPGALYNISSINVLSVPDNQLKGSLPANIGLTLRNLQDFYIGGNQFCGTIPSSFTNASLLEIFDISGNFFTGQVPNNFGDLRDLQQVNFEFNFLGSDTSQDLSFITSLSNCSNLEILSFAKNNFGGVLPAALANLSTKLSLLGAGGNRISGRLPSEVGNLVNLYALGLEENHFSGTIPISFGKLRKLQKLYLHTNLLSGQIPPSLGNLSQLYELHLGENKLQGNITSSIANCQNLQALDISNNFLIGFIPPEIIGLSSLSTILNLSHNTLTGPLPQEIHKLKNINALDVSQNKLYGEIPETIGDCLMLENLNMQGNFLQGSIPSTLASLRGLQHLDLSRNNLSGNIPKELHKLPFLQYVNLSFNNLEGEVPREGVFSNTTAVSLVGNKNLCGDIPELQLPACPIKRKKHKNSPLAIILATVISSIVLSMAITSLRVLCWRKSRKNPSSSPFCLDKLLRISHKELHQATQGFSSENLIGQGSFGSVYRGSLDLHGERIVAVKVLNLHQHGASKSFIAECRALRNIRHQNLVKILTYCSSIDFKGNDFKAFVLDFMVNGSLEMWLHPNEDSSSQPRNLKLLQRLRVAIDLSSALHYLHDLCETPIIHCDLKPSNILLDNDMTAHVGDFGLARLLSKTSSNSSQDQTSSIGIKGTIGYVPPEYGIGGEPTTYGDVYSFGIILLEIITGRRPIDEVFTDGLNLHNFVRSKLPGQVMQVLDPKLIATGEVGAEEIVEDNDSDDGQREIQENNVNIENLKLQGSNVQKCVVSVLKIGLACSVELPGDRMNMTDVTRKLNIITEAFLRARTHTERQIVNHN